MGMAHCTLEQIEAQLADLIREVGVADEPVQTPRDAVAASDIAEVVAGLKDLAAQVTVLSHALFGGDPLAKRRPLITRIEDLESTTENQEGRLRAIEDAELARGPIRAVQAVHLTLIQKLTYGAVGLACAGIVAASIKLIIAGG